MDPLRASVRSLWMRLIDLLRPAPAEDGLRTLLRARGFPITAVPARRAASIDPMQASRSE